MKFRQKLLFFGLAVATLTAVAVFLAGGSLLRSSVRDRVNERLASEVAALGDWIERDPTLFPDPGSPAQGAPLAGAAPARPSGGSIDADVFADRMGTILGLRVTLVAADGKVLGDSSRDGAALAGEENHASRPEILAARENITGTSVRHSATVNDELFYMARRITRNGQLVGFVRLAIPVRETERVTGGYSATLGAISFVILLVVSAVGYAAARRFSLPLEEMSQTADAIAAGRRDLLVEYESSDEIGQLGAAFNRMTRALSEQIQALSSEKKLRDAILGGMKEGILVVDRDKRVLLGNEAARTILGVRGQDLSGRPLIEIARTLGVIECFDAALSRREVSRQVIPAGAGSDRSFEINVAPLTDPAGVQVGAIGLFFDTTRMSALESVRRDFVADVSHELRTPLTSIKAFVETLLSGGLEDPSNNRRFLEIVMKHSDRMEAILDDLTDLSLIETGAVSLEPEPFDLASLIRDLIDSYRPAADAQGISLEGSVPAGTTLSADRRRVEQVLVNLIDNAIKFNRQGGKVIIRATSKPAAGGAVRIEVEDTGIGIPEGSLQKVFHRFYRVDRNRSREMGGTGLGLSIVKHLMQLHGGSIQVESELGRGSRFTLEFPASTPANLEPPRLFNS